LEKACRNFLGNEEAENYIEIIQELISLYSIMGCNMSLKLHLLHSHLDFFSPEHMGAVCDEHGESLIRIFPKLKRGTVENMLSDHCWSYIRETQTGGNKGQKKSK
jgi:hypothetical protein